MLAVATAAARRLEVIPAETVLAVALCEGAAADAWHPAVCSGVDAALLASVWAAAGSAAVGGAASLLGDLTAEQHVIPETAAQFERAEKAADARNL